jgi:hypothetical protein
MWQTAPPSARSAQDLNLVGVVRQAEKFIRIRRQATRQASAYRAARDAALLACKPH